MKTANKRHTDCSQFSRCAEVTHARHWFDNSWPATSKHPASQSIVCRRSTFNISQRSTFDSLNEISRMLLSAAAMSLRALSYCCKQTTKQLYCSWHASSPASIRHRGSVVTTLVAVILVQRFCFNPPAGFYTSYAWTCSFLMTQGKTFPWKPVLKVQK